MPITLSWSWPSLLAVSMFCQSVTTILLSSSFFGLVASALNHWNLFPVVCLTAGRCERCERCTRLGLDEEECSKQCPKEQKEKEKHNSNLSPMSVETFMKVGLQGVVVMVSFLIPHPCSCSATTPSHMFFSFIVAPCTGTFGRCLDHDGGDAAEALPGPVHGVHHSEGSLHESHALGTVIA